MLQSSQDASSEDSVFSYHGLVSNFIRQQCTSGPSFVPTGYQSSDERSEHGGSLAEEGKTASPFPS